MLQQLSWSAYGTGVAVLAIIYYAFIGLTFYRHELGAMVRRFSGKPAVQQAAKRGDIILPTNDIVGHTRTDAMEIVDQDELVFATPDEERPPKGIVQSLRPAKGDVHLLGDLAEMVSEAKTLIRVIHESNEPKEHFEMLFRLIAEKYPDLAGTAYEAQINSYLLHECADLFPFSLTENELQNYWLNEQKLQSA